MGKGISNVMAAIVMIVIAVVAGISGYFSYGVAHPPPTPAPKLGQGLNIWFIGGASSDPFNAELYNGAKAAADQLGVNLHYVTTGWDPQRMLTGMSDAIAANASGIVMNGEPGPAAIAPLLQQAYSKGIEVTFANVPDPNATAQYSLQGSGYVGQSLCVAGTALAQQTIKQFNIPAGVVVAIFSATWNTPTRSERAVCAENAFKANGDITFEVVHPESVYGDPSSGVPYVTGFYDAHPNVKVMIFDGGGTTAAAETYMKAIGVAPGQIIVAGFDMTPGALTAIEDGYLQLVITQQPWLQGYLSVVNLVLSLKYKFTGLQINTGGGFVSAANVKEVAPLVSQGICC